MQLRDDRYREDYYFVGSKKIFFFFFALPRILSKIFELQSVESEKLSAAEESAVKSRIIRLSGEIDIHRCRFLRWKVLL